MRNDSRKNNRSGRNRRDTEERRYRSRGHSNRERNNKKKRVLNAIEKAVGFALFFIGLILSLLMISTVINLDMLPQKYLLYIAIALGVPFLIFLILLLIKSTRWVAILLEIAMIIILGLLVFVLITSQDILKDISSASATTDTIVLYTKKGNSTEMLDYKNETIGILKILDRDNTDTSIAEIEKIYGNKINTGEYNSVTELMSGLNNDEVAAILINSAFLVLADDNADGQLVASEMQELWNKEIRRELKLDNIILALQEVQNNKQEAIIETVTQPVAETEAQPVTETETQLATETETQSETETETQSETETETQSETESETQSKRSVTDQTETNKKNTIAPATELQTSVDDETDNSEINYKPFVVYLSGNDSDGQLNANGRSDVNILMVVNPTTGKILLVNTPRDYYVKLAGKHEFDKLTHAGVFGVDESMQTISLLYETPIDYYVRLNFSGFMDIIDALGGITVYSDVDFTVAEWHYVVGKNDLSGIEALAFARERYSFNSGDRQRGKNQQAVIKGLISKICSPAILTNYLDLMTAVKGTVETNMSVDEIAELVRFQIDEKIEWSIESISVDGSDADDYCYSLQANNYVMIPDEKSVKTAKETIKKYLE